MQEGFETVEEFRGVGQGGLMLLFDLPTTPCVLKRSATRRASDVHITHQQTYRQSIAYAFAG